MSISFDRAAEYYDATRGYTPEVASAVGAAIAEAADAAAATRFLEIGVGTGRIALPVIALGHDYTGVDISPRMMDRLREKLGELERQSGRTPRATLLEADMQGLPFADGSFDAVIAAHVFHLVADPRRAVHEALRVLAPDGALLVCGDAVSGQEPVSVGERWRTIVRDAYGPVPNAREATDRLLLELLVAHPELRLEELRPVRWEYTTTMAEDLENIRRRLWSNTWLLPDALFDACLAQLTAWCETNYGTQMDRPLPRAAEFVIARIRRGG